MRVQFCWCDSPSYCMEQKAGNSCFCHMPYICLDIFLQSDPSPYSISTLGLLFFGCFPSQLAVCWLDFDILSSKTLVYHLHHRAYPTIMASNPNQDRYQCTADPSHTVAQAGTRCNDCIVRATSLALSSPSSPHIHQ